MNAYRASESSVETVSVRPSAPNTYSNEAVMVSEVAAIARCPGVPGRNRRRARPGGARMALWLAALLTFLGGGMLIPSPAQAASVNSAVFVRLEGYIRPGWQVRAAIARVDYLAKASTVVYGRCRVGARACVIVREAPLPAGTAGWQGGRQLSGGRFAIVITLNSRLRPLPLTTLHEVGHAYGLDHHPSRCNVMHAVSYPCRTGTFTARQRAYLRTA
ncbi:MAG TPA: hypothetical protein VNV66_08115 [Pilimelia sp.]|nr:hypothetical protein [Pilimelia sp.]